MRVGPVVRIRDAAGFSLVEALVALAVLAMAAAAAARIAHRNAVAYQGALSAMRADAATGALAGMLELPAQTTFTCPPPGTSLLCTRIRDRLPPDYGGEAVVRWNPQCQGQCSGPSGGYRAALYAVWHPSWPPGQQVWVLAPETAGP